MTVNVFVDKICAGYRDLKKDDFRIAEDKNDTSIGNFPINTNIAKAA